MKNKTGNLDIGKGSGIRRYLYEYVYHQAIETAREQTGQIIPISQAKAIRRDVNARLAEQGLGLVVADSQRGAQVAEPDVQTFLTAVNESMTQSIPDLAPIFASASVKDETYQGLQARFMFAAGVGDKAAASPRLPISPYDPEWSERGTVKAGGTALSYVPDEVIGRTVEGVPARLASPAAGAMTLWRINEDENKAEPVGKAMTDEDAAGLTALMDKMSEKEYAQVRGWLLDGARDPRTGQIDRNRFMSPAALARSVAMLDELQAQGLDYEVLCDQRPGQLKAKLADTNMEIRLTEPREREDFAGTRIYDNGVVLRYSTNHRVNRLAVSYSASPEEAVDLLRFAQGRPLERKDLPGELVGVVGPTHSEWVKPIRQSGRFDQVGDSYHVGKRGMFAVKDLLLPEDERGGEDAKVFIQRDARSRGLPESFVKDEAAEVYLRGAVDSARENFGAALNVDALIAHYEAQREAVSINGEDVAPTDIDVPEFSSDADIASIQRAYWDVLTGRRAQLLRPGATEEMLEERIGEIGELQAEATEIDTTYGNLVYGGSPVEKVRAHATDAVEEIIGTWEPETRVIGDDFADQRFDPMRVARYMTSEKGQWSNLDDLAAGLRRLDIGPEEMMGSGFQANRFKDRLVRFDETTAVPIADHTSDFMRRMGQTVSSSIERGAAVPTDVRVDDKGVIRWSAERMQRDGSTVEMVGEIGQVFDIGEHGEIITQFASGENALVVPGYEARIAAQKPGETKSVEERTLLRGYEQTMSEQIEYQVASDLFAGRSDVGEGASLNSVYSRLYGTKHPVDFIEKATTLEMDVDGNRVVDRIDPWTESILATEARRVRYANNIKAGSTVYAEYQAQRSKADPADDNHFDAWKLTGGRNMAVLTGKDENDVKAPEGYFDPVMTGGAMNQGVVRYLTTDAQVGPDGSITPGDAESLTGSRAPLMTRPELESLRYDPFDRQQMTASTLMQSNSVSKPTGTAMMTFGGWTADDPIVVSKEFAEANQIRGAGGRDRPLVVGDKISDFHGNKGVLSLIVDREMTLEEAREQGLEKEVAWFKANPGMDVVMSPFSLISRRNAGSARELMGSLSEDLAAIRDAVRDKEDPLEVIPEVAERVMSADLQNPDGTGTSSAVGEMRFIVTHMAVDEKTKIYDDEAVLSGKGRKASSQLAWALGSQDCPAIMREFYGSNSGAEANLREYLLSVGLDMEADGTLRVVGREPGADGRSHESLDERPERRLFEMPDLVRNSRGSLNAKAMTREFGTLIGDKGGDLEIPFPLRYPTGESTEQVSATSWKMPVLSSHLRSGQEFEDGSTVSHDYTNRYLDIFESACRYRGWNEQLADPELDEKKRAELMDSMSKTHSEAQRRFESITTDLEHRVFAGKSNYVKTGLMSSRLPDSATAVWTADPRLDIDQIAISPAMSEQLGLAENDHALVWRDPVLRDAGLRYMRVAVDERLTGAAINPVMDQCFDGDFDGDAVAIVKLHSEAAKAEALEKLSVPANLLETGSIGPNSQHDLAMQQSLDTKVALSKNPELAEEFDSAAREANRIALEAKRGASAEETRENQQAVTEELSDLYRQAQRGEFGSALSFKDREAHLHSVREVCVDTGAKGSERKLDDYARYLGDEQGTPGITEVDQEASMFATAIKAHGTGLGGSYSQRAVRALRNTDLKAVLEVTYPVTQSILQAKHDAAEARHKYEMLQGPGRDLWRGRRIEHVGPGQWRPEFADGEPVQATTEEWEKQFIDFYEAKDGFNVTVNPEYVGRVARGLTDPKTGLVRNLEDDVSLEGSLMDKMAYGGTLEDLITAADNHENLFDGEFNERFVSAATARARQTAEAQLDGFDQGIEMPEPVVADAVLKRDVIVDEHSRSQARGANRRSEHAVAAGRVQQPVPAGPAIYTPSIDIDQGSADGDYGMGE